MAFGLQLYYREAPLQGHNGNPTSMTGLFTNKEVIKYVKKLPTF